MVPVPFLEDAASYDLLTVLIKKPQLGQSLLRRQRCLLPVGPLEKLLQRGPAGRELSHCTREYNARVRGESRYEETRLVDGALRHIRLSMAGVHKKVAFLVLRPGTAALRPDLPWLRSQSSIYVIYEVFYCSSLALAVTQGAEHRGFHVERPFPVAFSCLKFALGGKGVLGSQKPMGHTLPARAAWVRMAVLEPPSPALPLEPPLPQESAAGRKRWRPLGRPSRPLAGEEVAAPGGLWSQLHTAPAGLAGGWHRPFPCSCTSLKLKSAVGGGGLPLAKSTSCKLLQFLPLQLLPHVGQGQRNCQTESPLLPLEGEGLNGWHTAAVRQLVVRGRSVVGGHPALAGLQKTSG